MNGTRGNAASRRAAGTLADFGWSWEGQGTNAPLAPSIYGVGEGAGYFGVRKVLYMYHPNNGVALEKLQGVDEVVCDITKWKSAASSYSGVQLYYDAGPNTVLEEAKTVAALSSRYRNISGAYFDRSLGGGDHGAMTASHWESVSKALNGSRPLRLWVRVSPEELYGKDWAAFIPATDAVALHLCSAAAMDAAARHLERCAAVFRGKQIVLVWYLWDYSKGAAMPLDALKRQCEFVRDSVVRKRIAGYAIFGTFLIESALPQARWLRDFIRMSRL